MPPLLCPSPAIVDHSYERPEDDLRRIAVALGAIVEYVSADSAHFLLTPMLRDVVKTFAAQPWMQKGLMLEIYRLLSQWFLQPHMALVELDPSRVTGYDQHPVPAGCLQDPLVEFWADDVGRLLKIHKEDGPPSGFAIGIACDKGFAGEPLGTYNNPNENEAFPLIAPNHGLSALVDAYEWQLDPNFCRKRVSFEAAKENCFALGATKVLAPKGDSHWKFVFPGGPRNWTLSCNDDPVPPRYLTQLREITGYPLPVIRQTLVTGKLPGRKFRFCRYLA